MNGSVYTDVNQNTGHVTKNLLGVIQAQAARAFSKINRNSGLEFNDFVQIGYISAWKAKQHYKPGSAASFNSYVTCIIKNDMYKAVRSSHFKKRGGGGCIQDAKRFGRDSIVESAKIINLDQHVEMGGSLPAVQQNDVEFDILSRQIYALIPLEYRPVYKQMVDPDTELLRLADEKCRGKNQFKIDKVVMAKYLNISVIKLTEIQKAIQQIVAQYLPNRIR